MPPLRRWRLAVKAATAVRSTTASQPAIWPFGIIPRRAACLCGVYECACASVWEGARARAKRSGGGAVRARVSIYYFNNNNMSYRRVGTLLMRCVRGARVPSCKTLATARNAIERPTCACYVSLSAAAGIESRWKGWRAPRKSTRPSPDFIITRRRQKRTRARTSVREYDVRTCDEGQRPQCIQGAWSALGTPRVGGWATDSTEWVHVVYARRGAL